ncbi:trypsin-like serine protease [Kribbella turkmenica]|uniref:Trypsin-like serine protease n=1 Tax=Kribbella turkmenica TaxID=2530375 RepID=A0A4R4X5E7_9ACTN|nr:S1 family peptidase [Kribbella turkmenica]TDD25601.1 trypsin-like serine protease [Kribbella turkmenica]
MRSSTLRRTAAAVVVTALSLAALPAKADPVDPPRLSAAAITSALEEEVTTPGTAWMTRPDGKVVVSYDSTVTGGKLTALTSVTRRLGENVVLEKLPGKLTKYVSGGTGMWGGDIKCSVGFNVQRRGKYYLLTAGHCGKEATSWYQDDDHSRYLGKMHHASYPWNDYALLIYPTNIKPPGGSVYLYNGRSQDITTAMNPGIGHYVYRAGITSGLHSGRVTGLNATVNYGDGRVAGLIRTSVCAEPGDSGGPLFYRQWAFGLTSGGSGDCDSGGVTYFQPVVEALRAYGVTVY